MNRKDSFSVTVTMAHLDEAIASWDDLSMQRHSVCDQCPVARAVKPILGPETWVAEHAMARTPVNRDIWEWQGDYAARRIVELFDAVRYDEIRTMLPVTVKFTYHTHLFEKDN
jgi:hypothetical protein